MRQDLFWLLFLLAVIGVVGLIIFVTIIFTGYSAFIFENIVEAKIVELQNTCPVDYGGLAEICSCGE